MENEVREIIEDAEPETFFNDDAESSYGDYAVKLVDDYGGEGQGDDYYTVFGFTKGDETVYVKFEGYYASHYGSEYQSWSFVKPVKKTITVYE